MIAADKALRPHFMIWPAAFAELDASGKMSTKSVLATWLTSVESAHAKKFQDDRDGWMGVMLDCPSTADDHKNFEYEELIMPVSGGLNRELGINLRSHLLLGIEALFFRCNSKVPVNQLPGDEAPYRHTCQPRKKHEPFFELVVLINLVKDDRSDNLKRVINSRKLELPKFMRCGSAKMATEQPSVRLRRTGQ